MKNNSVYRHFTAKEIRPSGWLKRQLAVQARGLSGNLDRVWPDIRDSAWIGGDREGWERVPYWLDGFIPLAYLLDDEDLKSRARKYVDAILSRQKPDGWICPCPDAERRSYDVWAVFLVCKALTVYEECSGDERIEGAVSEALRNLKEHLRGSTLFNWGQSRWFECLIPIFWLYDRTGEEWLVDLAVTLSTQGLDYKRLFACWRDREPRREWSFQTHIVNLMMALKSEALFSRVSGEDPDAFAQEMYGALAEYHGSAVGHITGDECLSGKSPVQGAELCSIAEAMYSCEILFEVTGNPVWADRAELLGFNSLPASVSEDMWTHQYLQLVNQIACCRQKEPPVYLTDGPESDVFGLEPNFGCCTANFNQAWPKLALSAYFRSGSGVVSSVLLPSALSCEIGGVPVRIELDTEYPFRGEMNYTVRTEAPVDFAFGIRVPSFASSASVDGKAARQGSVFQIRRTWNGAAEIHVSLAFAAKLNPCPDHMVCLQRGPLFFAVPIRERVVRREYEKNGVKRKFPYCDYDLFPESGWNYAFSSKDFSVRENGVGVHPFSRAQPPVTIETRMARIDWGTMPEQPDVCLPAPRERVPLSHETVRLQPYGCTNLRMTVMPYVP